MSNAVKEALDIQPLVTGGKSVRDVTEDILRPVEAFPTSLWWKAFLLVLTVTVVDLGIIGYLMWEGLYILGINNPVAWGFFIVNFVFWIGIGHAGTLISAVLYLFRQEWRTGINRAAEAMTIFAVLTAASNLIIHIGRPWVGFWLFPYPNERGPLWVNFRSPLIWDTFAVSTYLTISLVFWYIGLIPDIAAVRDRSQGEMKRKIYDILSLGWVGSNKAWSHLEMVAMILAALSTPLVLSVHTIVSFDFAVSILPGWHTTIFPPYFVAGAIFSGFAMVVTLMVIAREVFNLKDYITMKHLENMNKVIMVTGLIVGLAYSTEFFMAWYSGNEYEGFTFVNRAFGPYGWAYFIMFSCNVFSPQVFWWKKLRTNIPVMFIISIVVNIGMWFERYVIVMTTHADFLPSSWDMYIPTVYDFMMLIGTFGIFFTLFLLFCRIMPVIAVAEVKTVMPHKDGGHH
ncbi:NrfD/PsrC family molybdoenzyme membrane anchor subunit [Leptospira santarosai]|uniref:Fe-S-cluster-containing hydrogenase n=2 Tax=Leptospira santarosai TaxID=28183 RepID=K8YH39_9LEPT|nr:NrfD/PsrC family molybdoenzyme membrane anchor subunit [Leptospira santarosai]EMO59141.1 polysulfide reductase NrfD [Leptospira santarosai str. CBC1416]EKR92090.1 polysulfide reductase NrfD [Leptospira santarosai str. CBC379]EKS10002.1 polysulfide reductase NrfD [Leptospira santarosai str. JET]EKT88585.1 Fe-S-cluster-containing hydrogenase [Leptospira santarosai serovar Shermani str. LT 821]EMM88287.1 polysulfide reductase NrfD [Leptospira santarosai str. 2000027870]